MLSKMKLHTLYLMLVLKCCEGQLPWIEYEFDPGLKKEERISGGEPMPTALQTPDFRVEEDTWYLRPNSYYTEVNRPIRLSPSYKQTEKWRKQRSMEDPYWLGCYCTTVYKRLTLLAGCAVITTRHILTTATSTQLVLNMYGERPHLNNILGLWYDNNVNIYNSSMYATPARIHHHPRWIPPDQVNHTHPLPVTFDLSVWATTHRLYGSFYTLRKVIVCNRGGPHWWQYWSSTPRNWDLAIIVGFQFMKAFRRRPMPWFKYAIRTRANTVPCPKTEWGWMHCLPGSFWGRYGVESGASWHRALENRYWLYDGLIGIAAFSLRLRSEEITHYFTVINSHPVLDFLYASYMGRLPYNYLDNRFYDTQWRAPYQKPWAWVSHNYDFGWEIYKKFEVPIY